MDQLFYFTNINTAEKFLPWYLSGLRWAASALLGSIIGSVIAYLFTRWRDKKIIGQNKKDDLNTTSTYLSFYLALQQSELVKLAKNIEGRKNALNNLNRINLERDKLILITQDFDLCKEININIEKAGKIILSANKESGKIIEEIIQEIFISNQCYLNTLNMLERFHEAKRSITQNEEYFQNLLGFIERNLPEYEKQIEEAKSYSKKTLDSFKEKMKLFFDVNVNVGSTSIFCHTHSQSDIS